MIRLTIIAGLLPACMSPPQPESVPAPGLPKAWGSSASVDGVPVVPWWTGISPALQGLVDEALLNNHDLARASSRLRGALAAADAQGATLVPRVELGIGGRRSQQNFIGLPIPGRGSEVLSATFSSFDSALGASWEFDLWDRLGATARAAGQDARAAAGDLAAARQSIAAATCRAWVHAVEGRAQEELAGEIALAWGQTAAAVERCVEGGVAQAVELRRARASWAGALASVASARQVHDEARRQLELILGRYPSGDFLAGDLGEVQLPAVPPGVPVEVLGRRPDLLAAQARYEAARERAGAARAELWPSLVLTAEAGRSSGALEDLLDGDFSVWALAARLVAPIYDGGARRAGIEGADAACDEAAASLAGAILKAASEVERALSDGAAIGERTSRLGTSRAEASAAATLAGERYRAGLLDVEALLDARRGKLKADSQHLAARRDLALGRINLHLALGGGFEDRP